MAKPAGIGARRSNAHASADIVRSEIIIVKEIKTRIEDNPREAILAASIIDSLEGIYVHLCHEK